MPSHCYVLLYKYWLHERKTWEIVTPNANRGEAVVGQNMIAYVMLIIALQINGFLRGDNLPCYPSVQSIIIMLYWILIKHIVYITFGSKTTQVKWIELVN